MTLLPLCSWLKVIESMNTCVMCAHTFSFFRDCPIQISREVTLMKTWQRATLDKCLAVCKNPKSGAWRHPSAFDPRIFEDAFPLNPSVECRQDLVGDSWMYKLQQWFSPVSACACYPHRLHQRRQREPSWRGGTVAVYQGSLLGSPRRETSSFQSDSWSLDWIKSMCSTIGASAVLSSEGSCALFSLMSWDGFFDSNKLYDKVSLLFSGDISNRKSMKNSLLLKEFDLFLLFRAWNQQQHKSYERRAEPRHPLEILVVFETNDKPRQIPPPTLRQSGCTMGLSHCRSSSTSTPSYSFCHVKQNDKKILWALV